MNNIKQITHVCGLWHFIHHMACLEGIYGFIQSPSQDRHNSILPRVALGYSNPSGPVAAPWSLFLNFSYSDKCSLALPRLKYS